ncbi:MAG: hypothetical protein ACQESC_03185, partial [Nanobdellota archaeon]
MGVAGEEVFEDDLVLEYRGQYDYDGLIDLIRKFYDDLHMERKEPKYKNKKKTFGSEIEFKMEGDRKITHYIRVNLYVQAHMWDVDPKEVVVNGKKKMMTGGKLK